MKVLITTEFYLPETNGVVISVLNLSKALRLLGHEVRVLTIAKVDHSKFVDDCYYIKACKIQFYPDSFASIHTHDKLVDKIIDWHPDIVHSQCEVFTLLFAKRIAKACDIPVVHTCHTYFPDYGHYFSHFERAWMVLVKFACKAALRKISTIIVPSQKVWEMLTDDFHMKNKLKMIPTGLDLQKFFIEVNATELTTLRHSLGITEKESIFITVGRISKEKNLTELLEIYAKYCRRNKDSKLLIVGEGPEQEALEAQIAEEDITDRVLFTGFISQEQLPAYYKISDALVSASNSETQGLTFYEALASGIPLICKYDPCLEQILETGINGFYFDNEQEFSVAVKKITAPQVKRQFAQKAKESAIPFGLKKFGISVQEVYREAMSRYGRYI